MPRGIYERPQVAVPALVWAEEADRSHAISCLKAGGFPIAIRSGAKTVWLYPRPSA